MERVCNCVANCLRVAMEERPKVDIARKSFKFALFVCALQSRPRSHLLVAQLPRIAILHTIYSSLLVQRNEFFCSYITGETIKRLIQKERVSPRSAKHRPGMCRLHLRHCGKSWQHSQGSIFTPCTPQFQHVILARCRLDDISEIIEQK